MLMEIVTLSFLLIGIVFVLMGYINLFYNEKQDKKVIEYRFIPRNVYDNIESTDLVDQFSFMHDSSNLLRKTNLV